jgi:hypothetical protein
MVFIFQQFISLYSFRKAKISLWIDHSVIENLIEMGYVGNGLD